MAIPAFSELNKRQQLAILIGAPTLVAIILGTLSYRALGRLGPDPSLWGMLQRNGDASSLWAQIATLQGQIDEKQVIIDRKPKVEAELAALQTEISEAEERLPTAAEKAQMRSLIEKLAREVPTELGKVQFRAVKIVEGDTNRGERGRQSAAGDYQTIIYQTEIAGDLNGIIKYVDSIEKNPRFMTVRSLSVKPGTQSIDEASQKVVSGLHEVKMDLVTYVYNSGTGKVR